MSGLKDFADRYRDNQRIQFALWCVIGLGLVPAIVTENIFPLDGLGPRFGPEISEFIYLPGLVCLLVFLFGAAACLVQRRWLLLPLLLPWLGPVFVEAEALGFRMPTQWEAIDRLEQNKKLVQERAELPDPDTIRERIDRITYTDTGLMRVDIAALHEELDNVEEQLGASKPVAGDDSGRIAHRINLLSRQIRQTDAQIRAINKSLATINMISRFSFGLADPALKQKLRKSLKKVKRNRGDLISKRNVQRVELDRIRKASVQLDESYAQLRDLEARTITFLWASQSYRNWLLSLAYKAICFGVMLVLLWQFALGSWVYLLTLAAALTVALLYVDATLSYRLWVVTKFSILSMMLRAAYLVFKQNRPLLRGHSKEFLLRTSQKTLLYYLPFIALIALGVLTSLHINRLIDDQLYGLEIMQGADREAPRRYNIDKAIDDYFDRQEDQAHQKLEALRGQAGMTSQKVAEETVRIFESNVVETLPEIDESLRPPDCGGFLPWVFDTPDCAEHSIKQPLNEEWTESRNEQRDNLQRSTDRYATEAPDNVNKAIDLAKADLSENFLAMKQSIKKQLSILYSAIDFYTWVSLLILIVFTLKSLLYVFSRIFFATDPDGTRVIQFEPATAPQQLGRVQEVSDTLELASSMGKVMYTNKKYDFANAPPDEVTPQAQRAFLSRFRFGVWHMNRIQTTDRDVQGFVPYKRIPADERVIVWTLKPGDAVVFSWKSFVGMSDGIQIRTQYSWQLSSLIFGRMFFVVASVDADASEDGTLLLAARGTDGIHEAVSPSNSPDQLLAWQTTTRFHMHAHLSFRNVYRSGIQIKAFDEDLAVMHLNEKRQRSGAAAFLKYFLAPV